MARDNRLGGAERIRGELLKLSIHVSIRTIQKCMRAVRTIRPHGQTWRTFIHTHAQQRSYATAFGVGPKYLIRDNDSKFGVAFARVAQTSGIEILKTPYHAPQANAICERFLGSVRRECLDHVLILQEKLAYLRSFVPSCTEKDNHRERMALPCQNPEGNHGKLIRMTKLYSQERYSHEEVEEVIEEMKPSLFSADVTSSQHKFDPTRNTFLECVKAEIDSLLDRSEHIQHEWNLFFAKIGAWSEHARRIDLVDCTRISALWQESLLHHAQQADFLNGCFK